MADITINAFSHIRLTVSDLERSRTFYTEVLGFDVVSDAPPPESDPDHDILEFNLQHGVILKQGAVMLGLRPSATGNATRFDENQPGLDHLSFTVGSIEQLRAAAASFDAHGVPHGEIVDLGSAGMVILPFRDPDNIQLELAAVRDS